MAAVNVSSKTHYQLVGDLGGTNARLALLKDGVLQLDSLRVLPANQFDSLEAALAKYLRECQVPIDVAALAIASTIPADADATIRFTNHHWAFSRNSVLQKTKLAKLLLLNDFEALARALPALETADLQCIAEGSPIHKAPKVVLGPGTGLGVASLVFSGSDALGWIPITGEGGHASVSPGNPLETEILRVVWQDFPHISWERLVSGIGLPVLYRAVATVHGYPPAADIPENPEIVAAAMAKTDALAQEVIAVFCGLLGAAAGNLALTVGARGGVYLAGGIAQALAHYLPTSGFRERFIAKGRFQGYLEAIPVYLIQSAYPALLGCSLALAAR